MNNKHIDLIVAIILAGIGGWIIYHNAWDMGFNARVDYEIHECLVNNYCLRKVTPDHRGLIPN